MPWSGSTVRLPIVIVDLEASEEPIRLFDWEARPGFVRRRTMDGAEQESWAKPRHVNPIRAELYERVENISYNKRACRLDVSSDVAAGLIATECVSRDEVAHYILGDDMEVPYVDIPLSPQSPWRATHVVQAVRVRFTYASLGNWEFVQLPFTFNAPALG